MEPLLNRIKINTGTGIDGYWYWFGLVKKIPKQMECTVQKRLYRRFLGNVDLSFDTEQAVVNC